VCLLILEGIGNIQFVGVVDLEAEFVKGNMSRANKEQKRRREMKFEEEDRSRKIF
jgi:hypothetical protein